MTIYRVSTILAIVSRGISFQPGDATISNKLLRTKISTESLTFLFFKAHKPQRIFSKYHDEFRKFLVVHCFPVLFGYVLRKCLHSTFFATLSMTISMIPSKYRGNDTDFKALSDSVAGKCFD